MIGIILIFHNNENSLNFNLIKQILNVATELHFCLVNNGSSDSTLDLLNEVKQNSNNQISVLDIKKYKSDVFALKSAARYLNSIEKIKYYGYLEVENTNSIITLKQLIHSNNQIPIKSNLQHLINPKENRLIIKKVFLLIDYTNTVMNNKQSIIAPHY